MTITGILAITGTSALRWSIFGFLIKESDWNVVLFCILQADASAIRLFVYKILT